MSRATAWEIVRDRYGRMDGEVLIIPEVFGRLAALEERANAFVRNNFSENMLLTRTLAGDCFVCAADDRAALLEMLLAVMASGVRGAEREDRK
jgi:hypothetical protein